MLTRWCSVSHMFWQAPLDDTFVCTEAATAARSPAKCCEDGHNLRKRFYAIRIKACERPDLCHRFPRQSSHGWACTCQCRKERMNWTPAPKKESPWVVCPWIPKQTHLPLKKTTTKHGDNSSLGRKVLKRWTSQNKRMWKPLQLYIYIFVNFNICNWANRSKNGALCISRVERKSITAKQKRFRGTFKLGTFMWNL